MQLTRHPAAAPQNPGPKVAQGMVRFEVKEVIEVHKVMNHPEAIFGSEVIWLVSFLGRDGLLVNDSLFPDFKERLDTELRPTEKKKKEKRTRKAELYQLRLVADVKVRDNIGARRKEML